jgi:hypothetical protein
VLVTVSIANPLPIPSSVERLQGFTAKLKAKFDVPTVAEEKWLGNVLRFDFTGKLGNRFVGTVRAGENTIEVAVESDVFDDAGSWAERKVAAAIRRAARKHIESALAEALGG